MRLTADGKPIPKPAAKREVWTADDVAAYLNCSARHVTNLARRKELPGKQFGRLWRFRRQEIEALFEERNPENPR